MLHPRKCILDGLSHDLVSMGGNERFLWRKSPKLPSPKRVQVGCIARSYPTSQKGWAKKLRSPGDAGPISALLAPITATV